MRREEGKSSSDSSSAKTSAPSAVNSFLQAMKLKSICLLLIPILLMSTNISTHADKPPLAADLIIFNARVRTMDQSQPAAEAVAIYGNRFVAVGSTKEIRKLASGNTKIIDAKGRLVLPGFNDAHVHFMSGGFQLSSV